VFVVTIVEPAIVDAIAVGGGGGDVTLRHMHDTLSVNRSITASLGGTFELAGGVLAGTNLTLAGTIEWRGGNMGSASSRITLEQGGVLNARGVSSARTSIFCSLTNRGTINLLGSELYFAGAEARLVNSAEGLVDARVDNLIWVSGSRGRGIENYGVLRKSGGVGTMWITSGVSLVNHGVVEVLAGHLLVHGGGRASGRFVSSPKTMLDFASKYTLGESGSIGGAGTNRITSNAFTVEGRGVLSNIWMLGTVAGTNLTLAGTIDWDMGDLGAANSRITLAEGGVLNVRGNPVVGRLILGNLTNRGTINLLGAGLYLGGADGRLVNEATGLVDIQADTFIERSSSPDRVFENNGVIRKSGGAGTARIKGGVALVNHGEVRVLAGRLVVEGGGRTSGRFVSLPDAILEFASSYTFGASATMGGVGTNRFSTGTLTMEGMGVLSNIWMGGTVLGTNLTLAGTIEWEGGDLGNADSRITLAEGGVLNVRANNLPSRHVYASLTNAGTINLLGPNLYLSGSSGRLVNLEGGLVDSRSDHLISYSGSPGRVIENRGTLRKSVGNGATTVATGVNLQNSGVLEALSGTFELSGGYTQHQAGLRVGLRGLSDFGKLRFMGTTPLGETVSVVLLGGYHPSAGSAFGIIDFGARPGNFLFELSHEHAWQTAQGAGLLTLTFRNTRPILPPTPDLEVAEQSVLSLNLAAADSDAGQGLAHTLLGAPAGAALDPTTGAFLWTPTEAQGPGVYSLALVATDNGQPPLSETNRFQIVVREVNQPPVITGLADQRANAGNTISLSVLVRDADLPAQAVALRLVAGPAGATLDASGTFSWKVGAGQAGSTNRVQIVADDGAPQGESSREFTVVVDPLPEFILTTSGLGAQGFGLTMNALPGLDYVLQGTLDFSSWLDLATNTPTTSMVEFTAPANPNPVQVFRVRVLP